MDLEGHIQHVRTECKDIFNKTQQGSFPAFQFLASHGVVRVKATAAINPEFENDFTFWLTTKRSRTHIKYIDSLVIST